MDDVKHLFNIELNILNFSFHLSLDICVRSNRQQDHTFCGIMFNVEVLDDLPVDHVQINSIWVRGALGDMSIYTTPEGWEGKHERDKEWIKLYVVFEDESEHTHSTFNQ